MIRDDLPAAFEPWMTPDLRTYLEVIGEMYAEVELYSDDGELEGSGWTILLDPDRAPVAALPYLAQYVGERLPVGIDEAGAREWIKDAPNQRRGTLESIVFAAQRSLTGERTVSVLERAGENGTDNPDRLFIGTYVNETPDPARVLRDLRGSVVPADIELVYQTLSGQTWQSVRQNNATWAAVRTKYATWQAARDERTGYTTWTRPRVPS